VTGISENGSIMTPNQKSSLERLKFKKMEGDIFNALFLRKTHIASPTVTFRRECIDKLGGFDEYLSKLGAEDREMWLRISRYFKVGYINEELAFYRHRRNSASKHTKNMIRGRYYIIKKFQNNLHLPLKSIMEAYASIHRELSWSYLQQNEIKKAMKEAIISIYRCPLSVIGYKTFLRVMLCSKRQKNSRAAL
jgi:predicted glycosyltransferase involved in capsule biosynthesis